MKKLLLLLSFTLFNNLLMAQNTEPISFLALGDSYTIGESVSETERWPIQLAAELAKKGYSVNSPKIIAKTGWRTDELMAAINADENLEESYDLVSLLIGVNNQYQGKTVTSYEPEFEQLLIKAIELAGGNADKVFVVSIPDYGKTPFGKEKEEQIEIAIDKYNEVNKYFAKKYGVRYFDITPISRRAAFQENLVAADGLHPSGEMYTMWVELMVSKVARMLKK